MRPDLVFYNTQVQVSDSWPQALHSYESILLQRVEPQLSTVNAPGKKKELQEGVRCLEGPVN